MKDSIEKEIDRSDKVSNFQNEKQDGKYDVSKKLKKCEIE